MTLKNQRRKLARALRKKMGLPFIMAKRIAKMVDGTLLSDLVWELPKKGAMVKTGQYCPCCGPSHYHVEWDGQEFSFDIYDREIYNEKGEVCLKELKL